MRRRNPAYRWLHVPRRRRPEHGQMILSARDNPGPFKAWLRWYFQQGGHYALIAERWKRQGYVRAHSKWPPQHEEPA